MRAAVVRVGEKPTAQQVYSDERSPGRDPPDAPVACETVAHRRARVAKEANDHNARVAAEAKKKAGK